MIQLRSFIKVSDQFVGIEDFSGPVEDPEYIEGAIELTVNNTPLLTQNMWDYVDQLWSYLVDALTELNGGKLTSTYFPDQAIEISLNPLKDGRVEIIVANGRIRRSVAERDVLISTFCAAGEAFFTRMLTLVPAKGPSYLLALERIAALRSAI